MKTQINKRQELVERVSVKARLAAASVLCLAGGVGMTYSLTQASASEYSLSGASVELNGQSNGTATVALKTSTARTYVDFQGTWSTHEVVDTGETQTNYLTLSSMAMSGSSALSYNASNGVCTFVPLDGSVASVAAGGNVMTATYTVDKDGNYNITLFCDNAEDLKELDKLWNVIFQIKDEKVLNKAISVIFKIYKSKEQVEKLMNKCNDLIKDEKSTNEIIDKCFSILRIIIIESEKKT